MSTPRLITRQLPEYQSCLRAIAGAVVGALWVTEQGRTSFMKVGDRVRVCESVMVYHHPKHRNEAFDLNGQEGDVIGFANEWKGKTISANFPVKVKFEGKLRAHLRESELEVISEA